MAVAHRFPSNSILPPPLQVGWLAGGPPSRSGGLAGTLASSDTIGRSWAEAMFDSSPTALGGQGISPGAGRRRRVARRGASLVGLGGVLAAILVVAGCSSVQVVRSGSGSTANRHHSVSAVSRPDTTTTASPTPSGPVVPQTTVDAMLNGDAPGSPAPGAPANVTVPGEWYDYPSILPVVAQQSGWVEVRLAQRPNESTAWVPAGDVSLSNNPYWLYLNLTTMHLTVYQSGRPIYSFPAGIGTPDDPTVTGQYFITMHYPAPDPGYGPFVLVTSAHSDSITDWAGTGDAIIAIHGPIDSYDDSLIGSTGAAISHGCIRLHDADLAQLAPVPAGTPLQVSQ